MKEPTPASGAALARCGALLVFFGLYVKFAVDPRIFYHAFGFILPFPAFAADAAFLKPHLTYPGGPMEYLAALLSQGYFYSWLGAAILTVIAWLVWAGMRVLIGLAGEPRARFLAYVPVLLLLALCNGCDHVLTLGLVLSAVIWLSVGCEKLPVRRGPLRVAFFVLVFAFSYWMVAANALVVVFLVSTHECIARRRWFAGLAAVVSGAAAPGLLGAYVFDLVWAEAYTYLSPLHSEVRSWLLHPALAFCMYLAVPVIVLIVSLWHVLRPRGASTRIAGWWRTDRSGQAPLASRRRLRALGKWAVGTAALAAACLLTLLVSSNPVQRTALWMQLYSRQRMWPEILARARRLPAGFHHPALTHDVNRALYHSGKLSREMFSFPQEPYALLLFPSRADDPLWKFRRASQVLLELGDVNGSEWQACEALEIGGSCPAVLETLALISIAKGQTETARIYLSVQSKDLIYGARARALLHRLDRDPMLSGDRAVRRLRSLMPVEDFIPPWQDPDETLLLKLLERNPGNRMAFEYLMAHYLLTGRVDKVVENIGRLDDFGYGQELPAHYEEAVLLHTEGLRRKVDLRGRRIGPEAIARFDRFAAVCSASAGDVRAAQRRLAGEFGRSYYFYWTFGKSGVRE